MTAAPTRRPGAFVWFEHLSADPSRARPFYEALFGWRSMPVPLGLPSGGAPASYDLILRTEGEPSSAIGGWQVAPPGVPPQWLSSLSVDDVDAAHAAVLDAGGRSFAAPAEFPPYGRAAVVADPTGAPFTLWRGAFGDPPDASPVPAGGWLWSELLTDDAERAVAFYARAFGHREERLPIRTSDGGTRGTYHLLKDAAGVARAGVMALPEPGRPAMWLPYLAVDDVDATAARVPALGGQVLRAPDDIPGVGRFAVLKDPAGAVVAVMKPAPRAG